MSSKLYEKTEGEPSLDKKWNNFLRQNNKRATAQRTLCCPLCTDRKVQPDDDALWLHVQAAHPDRLPSGGDRKETERYRERIRSLALAPIAPRPSRDDSATKPHEDLAAIEADSLPAAAAAPGSTTYRSTKTSPLTTGGLEDFQRTQYKEESIPRHSDLPSPHKSNKKRALGDGRSPTSSVRTAHSTDDVDHDGNARPPTTGKRLYEPDAGLPTPNISNNTSPRTRSSPQHLRKLHRPPQPSGQHNASKLTSNVEPGTIPISVLNSKIVSPLDESKIVRQPETRPISQEQLVAEVKGIYAGLVMVEGKCIQVDSKQAALAREAPEGTQPKLNNEQWQALIALHRTLLHEHHDFFLASQHPSATPAVRKLALKYAMPARLWRHGIHSFLELLRNRLPDSLDHMLAFIYLAYSMMTLLYETVPAFEETWIECLGDLGRYRMAIEDDDIRDREVWTQVARQWYLKASDRSPRTGRLYHHLAILARPNALQQLFYYVKALSVAQPFLAAKESILTLFDPILSGKQGRRLPAVIAAFIKAHAVLFLGKTTEGFTEASAEFGELLDGHISRVTQRYLEQGYLISISNCLALLGFGSSESILSRAISNPGGVELLDTDMSGTNTTEALSNAQLFMRARQIFVDTIDINCQRVGDPNILSALHVYLVFMVYLSRYPSAIKLVENQFPWSRLVNMLNALIRFYKTYSRIETDSLPIPEKNDLRPTPEEFAMRGLDFAENYSPAGWFANKNIEDENQYKEDASMNTDYRPERIIWLGRQLAISGSWYKYDHHEHRFLLADSVQASSNSRAQSVPSEVEADSEVESATDSATLMADCDVMSPQSGTSTGISEDPHEEEFGWESHDNTRMETEEGSTLTPVD